MTVALLAVVVIALGLPLTAFWLGGRRFWGRLRSRPHAGDRQGLVYREMVLKHHLRPAEIAQVEGAVTWGRRLEEPRLRAAVVDWARALRADAAERRAAHPQRRRVLLVLAAAWLTGGLATAVLAGPDHPWGALVRVTGYALLFGISGWLAARGPRRAIQRNSDPPSSAGGIGEQPR